jgi:hypothetical protein
MHHLEPSSIQWFTIDALDPFSPNYGQMKPWVAKNDPSKFYERADLKSEYNPDGGTDKSVLSCVYRVDDKELCQTVSWKKI